MDSKYFQNASYTTCTHICHVIRIRHQLFNYIIFSIFSYVSTLLDILDSWLLQHLFFTHKEILSWPNIYAQFSTNLKPQPSHFSKELVEKCSYLWCTDHLTAHLHSVCEMAHRGTWSQRRTGSTCHRSQWRRHCSPAPCALPSASDLHSPGHKRKEK